MNCELSKVLVGFLFLGLSVAPTTTACFAQASTTYWQQQVNYNITVSLNDQTHELNGFANIQYINNSPDVLNNIVFHLYPNAYSTGQTAFAQQELENRSTKFYFSKDADRGKIFNLLFKVDGETVAMIEDANHPDIAGITLNKPLQPGDTINISTPFSVKIPTNFSRLGRDGESYQLTQWYPKPAVYDKQGWHPLPYLNQGEFYSNFGNYEVEITVPENYIVAATGELQTESELQFLREVAQKTAKGIDYVHLKGAFDPTEFPTSSATTKTLTFIQKEVIDFAWFADKRFNVLKSEVTLASGKTVDTWAFFTNKNAKIWAKATSYLDDAVAFYSSHVGEYPYKVCTAVEGTLIAGGGMEYPTITIIGGTENAQTLDRVITHEVGHNWFQGILATNERSFPYLDEGINSYYENRYMDEKYPTASLIPPRTNAKLSNFITKQFNLTGKKLSYQNEIGYLMSCRLHADQACNLHSEDYTQLNYGLMVYGKTAMAFRYLENFLGRTVFDELMKTYFDQWKFKHPYPKDLRSIFEDNTNKYLDWFFDEVLATTGQMDYAIVGQDDNKTIGNSEYYNFFIKNKGELRSPFPVTALKNKQPVKTIWYDGFGGMSEILFPKMEIDELVIDYEEITIESHRKNNNFKPGKLFKKIEPLKVRPLLGFENPKYNQLFASLMSGYNYWDKYMLGVALHSGFLPSKKLEWFAAPMYSFNTKSVVGFGNVNYHHQLKSSTIKNIRLGLGVRSFHDYQVDLLDSNKVVLNTFPNRFYRFSPELAITFRKPDARNSVTTSLTLKHINLMRTKNECEDSEETLCTGIPLYVNLGFDSYYINQLTFKRRNQRIINPLGYAAMVEQGKGFVRLAAEGDYKLSYINNRKGIQARGYFSWFAKHENTQAGFVNNSLGYRTNTQFYDYTYEDMALARNKLYSIDEEKRRRKFNILDHQIVKNGAAFFSNTNYGANQQWLGTINLKADLPLVPVYAYFNTAFFPNNNELGSSAFEFGAALSLIPNVIELYFPVAHHEQMYRNAKYFEKITFLFHLKKLDLFKILRNNNFL